MPMTSDMTAAGSRIVLNVWRTEFSTSVSGSQQFSYCSEPKKFIVTVSLIVNALAFARIALTAGDDCRSDVRVPPPAAAENTCLAAMSDPQYRQQP